MANRHPAFFLIDSFSDEFRDLGKEISPTILKHLEAGLPPGEAVDRAFSEHRVPKRVRDLIMDRVVLAAALGYGVDEPTNPKQIRRTFLNRSWAPFAGPKMKLSERLHRMEFKRLIIQDIRQSMKNQSNFTTLANSLVDKDFTTGQLPKHLNRLINVSRGTFPDAPEVVRALKKSKREIERLSRNGAPTKELKAAYSEVVRKIEKGAAERLGKSVEIAILEKARANAARVARTEIASAHGLAFDFRSNSDPDVLAIKYSLSTRHADFDICNFHTSANLYKMGPGIYPVDKHPRYPFHPHCMCVPSQVFRGEVEEKRQMSVEAGNDWIDGLSDEQRKRLLGVRRSKFYRQSGNWRGLMPGWETHKSSDFRRLRKKLFE